MSSVDKSIMEIEKLLKGQMGKKVSNELFIGMDMAIDQALARGIKRVEIVEIDQKKVDSILSDLRKSRNNSADFNQIVKVVLKVVSVAAKVALL